MLSAVVSAWDLQSDQEHKCCLPLNVLLQIVLPDNTLQTVGGNADCLEACEYLGQVKMNRHFVFLVPKGRISWVDNCLNLACPCCWDRIPAWHLFLDGNSVDTFCSLRGRMVSAAFWKAGKEVLHCCLCLTESTHCSKQVDITRGVNSTGRTAVVTSPKHSKKTKMMQPKWKLLLGWLKILRSSSSHLLAFGPL